MHLARFTVDADLERGAMITVPQRCPSDADEACASLTFHHLEQESVHTDYQASYSSILLTILLPAACQSTL